MKTIYLDYAAATPLDPNVLMAMRPYFSDKFYNPSATYLAARDVRRDIEGVRATIAHYLGARSREIIFSSGGTEANNLAIHGVMAAFPGKQLLVSAIEHDSIIKPASKYKHTLISVLNNGRLDLDKLKSQITDDTVLISIMYANNEVGTIQPIAEAAKLIQQVRVSRQKAAHTLPIYLHTDACQAPVYLDLHVARLGVDMLTLNGGKIYGPKQSGVLFIKAGTTVQPIVLGGGQERGMRSGTENVPSIIGFGAALESVQKRRQSEVKRTRALQQQFIDELMAAIPQVIINGSTRYRLPNNVHITIPGQDNERLMMQLDEKGIQCAVGSACSASSEDPSHVLMAMGLAKQQAQSSLRLSMGRHTTSSAVSFAVKTLTSSLW